MKKRSLFIVVAMVLLLAVVLGMGGTTFAKYITKDDGEGNATVAKWGYVVTIATEKTGLSTLFNTDYKDTKIVATAADNKADVKAASTTVAPGTTGYFTISVDGTAEVLSKVTFDFNANKDVKLAAADSGATDYYPVRWTVTDESDQVVDGAQNLTLAELDAWFDEQTAVTEPQNQYAIDWTITWDWDFHVDDTTDGYDTKLGDMAKNGVGTNGSSVEIDFDLTVTVEQIQNADRT